MTHDAAKPANGAPKGSAGGEQAHSGDTTVNRLTAAYNTLCAIALIGFAALAVLGWTTFDWPEPLDAALAAMTLFVLLQTVAAALWVRGAATAIGDDTGNPYADAAKVTITTQGVVLGLVTFKTGDAMSATAQVGACSLVAGVLLAVVLYYNVATGLPSTTGQAFTASVLFTLVLWALSFGLICVVAATFGAS
jgi:hypothetical protein